MKSIKNRILLIMTAIFTWLGTKLGTDKLIPLFGKLIGQKMLIPAFEILLSKDTLKEYCFQQYYIYAKKDFVVKTETITVKNKRAKYDVVFIVTPKGAIKINLGRHKAEMHDEMNVKMPEKINPIVTAKNMKVKEVSI